MKNRIVSVFSNLTDRSIETKSWLGEKFAKAGFTVKETFDPKSELIVCIGGDGAFLRALHDCGFPEIPFLGINTGHLGFFQEYVPENVDLCIENYLNKQYRIQSLTTVEAEVSHSKGNHVLSALNEVVIRTANFYTVHLGISIGGSFIERFSGDGICVASPAGSTAYNYSLGGAIVDPRLKVLQVTPIAPMNTTAYRSFTSSILLPSDLYLGVVPEEQYVEIKVITDSIENKFENVKEVKIKISDKKVNLVRFESYDFWDKVKTKFL
jgi:NAD+ kinase